MSRVLSNIQQGYVLNKVIRSGDPRSVAEAVRLKECSLFDSIKIS
jgi:hypothetical protein